MWKMQNMGAKATWLMPIRVKYSKWNVHQMHMKTDLVNCIRMHTILILPIQLQRFKAWKCHLTFKLCLHFYYLIYWLLRPIWHEIIIKKHVIVLKVPLGLIYKQLAPAQTLSNYCQDLLKTWRAKLTRVILAADITAYEFPFQMQISWEERI